MRLAKIIALLSTAVMTAALCYGFTQGEFAADGQRILSNPWGIVSLVDLYTGFVLFSGWVVYREKDLWAAVLWVILILVLGTFIGALYVTLTLFRSGGNWRWFWMGAHATEVNPSTLGE